MHRGPTLGSRQIDWLGNVTMLTAGTSFGSGSSKTSAAPVTPVPVTVLAALRQAVAYADLRLLHAA